MGGMGFGMVVFWGGGEDWEEWWEEGKGFGDGVWVENGGVFVKYNNCSIFA